MTTPAPRPTPTRRAVLRATGLTTVASLGAISLAELATAARAASPSATRALTTSTGCATLTPEETQGPFWIDERLQRSDIRADSETGAVQAGIPLTLTITLLDAGGSCSPQQGAYVDIWHANAQGAYSDVSGQGNPNNIGVDWLRGYQVSDENGQVTFTTIYPGWYVSRTIHIHFRVRTSLSDGSAVNFTSQIFFAESVNAAVVATSAYQKSGTRTTNSTDSIYDAVLLAPVSGSTAAGYTAAFTVNLDFGDGAPTDTPTTDTPTTDTPTTDSPTDTPTSEEDTTVAATVVGATVVRRGRRRLLQIELDRDERVAAQIRLIRDDVALVSRRTGWLAAGRSTVRFRVPKGVDAGTARVVVALADAAGNVSYTRRRVRVPA